MATAKKITGRSVLLYLFLFSINGVLQAQEVVKAGHGAVITIQDGAELVLMGGISLDKGSTLTNNGIIRLKQNGPSGPADWIDNTATGYNYGSGKVIFNSTSGHSVYSRNTFGRIEADASGHINLASDISTNTLLLADGILKTTSSYKLIVYNSSALAVEAGAGNDGFSKSWVNGTVRRYVVPAIVDNYVFPVGDANRSNRVVLDNLITRPLTDLNYIDASFGLKPGSDIGLSARENGQPYIRVSNGGVWWLVPDVQPAAGYYDALFYLGGLAVLDDNSFAVVNRPVLSRNAADWVSPVGSSLPAVNQPGRVFLSGYTRRNNMKDFGQFGIGIFSGLHTGNLKATGKASVSVLVYPNPSDGQFTIRLNGTDRAFDAVITDMGGKVVKQLRLANANNMNVTGLPSGTYMIRITDVFGPGESFREKVVVVK